MSQIVENREELDAVYWKYWAEATPLLDERREIFDQMWRIHCIGCKKLAKEVNRDSESAVNASP